MPPRHGKSELISKFLVAWFLGTYPDKRVILSSYEANFAASWGGKARELLKEYGWVFGVTLKGDTTAKNHWGIEGRRGEMQTAGVGGSITGKGADLLIIDDPVKGQEDAFSEVQRESAWDWYQSVADTRLEPDGVVILIQTRWNEDDLMGRILAHEPSSMRKWRKAIMPALAEENDCLGRAPGEALWPERFSREKLLEIKSDKTDYWWSAMFQQRPAPEDGLLFKRSWFKIITEPPAQLSKVARYWDCAGTDNGGDYSVGALVGEYDGLFYVLDIVRGQWSPMERNNVIEQTAKLDAEKYKHKLTTWIEQEPGSSGKESVELMIRRLAGYYVKAERVTGEKTTRWRPFSAQCEGGNVSLISASWNSPFLSELCVCPNGTHDDQADAASGAFNKLAMKRKVVMGIA